jgi:hypothetical protein
VSYEFAERRGEAVAEAARTWLGLHPGRVFVWVHLFDPHAPYDPPPAFRGSDLYRGEVAAADAAVAALMGAWDARPEPSIVVLAADHGEAFGEHGEQSHSLFVYDATLHVPLLVRGPGWTAGGRVSTAVGLTDIAATIVEAVGPGGPMLPGRSLRRFVEGAPASRSTRRRSRRASTSAGATSVPGATGNTNTSGRRGRSSTISPPIRPNPATCPPLIPTSWRG